MDHFPSPPMSPAQQYYHDDDDHMVFCGSCDKALSSDWFCINCHKRCSTCNRFLSVDDHCSRCWTFDDQHNIFVRKQPPLLPAAVEIPATHTMLSTLPPSPPHQEHRQTFFLVASNFSPTREGKMHDNKP
ncbi:hypothetical protein BX666DRAFT_1915126 [Dichotomocladium elegans]|nr:hypothetical protein BX666DRAFT_1915126 [Dichotomocladium elegans]